MTDNRASSFCSIFAGGRSSLKHRDRTYGLIESSQQIQQEFLNSNQGELEEGLEWGLFLLSTKGNWKRDRMGSVSSFKKQQELLSSAQ